MADELGMASSTSDSIRMLRPGRSATLSFRIPFRLITRAAPAISLAINRREADSILASSDVKGVFAVSWESLSMCLKKGARSTGYVKFIVVATGEKFFLPQHLFDVEKLFSILHAGVRALDPVKKATRISATLR